MDAILSVVGLFLGIGILVGFVLAAVVGLVKLSEKSKLVHALRFRLIFGIWPPEIGSAEASIVTSRIGRVLNGMALELEALVTQRDCLLRGYYDKPKAGELGKTREDLARCVWLNRHISWARTRLKLAIKEANWHKFGACYAMRYTDERLTQPMPPSLVRS